jgi:hypothetical protein
MPPPGACCSNRRFEPWASAPSGPGVGVSISARAIKGRRQPADGGSRCAHGCGLLTELPVWGRWCDRWGTWQTMKRKT